jgi:spermidine synthase
LHDSPRDIAIVGLGLGITTRAILNNPAVENVRLVELSPEMVAAHRTHPEIAGNVLADPKLKLRIDDGRNFMSMSADTFDMITADPIHPRISGVGYLYTKEYYEALKNRLNANGVVLQWMPMYGISLDSFNAAFRTFAEVFPHASFWYVRGHGLFLGGLEPLRIDGAKVAGRTAAPAVAKDLASIGIDGWQDLLGYLLMDESHIKAYLAADTKKIVNTDDNAYLEYKTPNEFLHRTHIIVEALKPFAGWNGTEILQNVSEDERLAIEQRIAARRARLSQELDDPID